MQNAHPRTSIVALLLALCAPVSAAPPALIPVQGHLTDTDGVALEGGHDFRFVLYGVPIGGSPLHVETLAGVMLTSGDFIVYLGAQSSQPIDLDLFTQRDALWLEVTVDGDQVISPRFRLGTAPYAASSLNCQDSRALDGRPAAEFLHTDDPLPWSALSGVPASLLDGDGDTLGNLSCALGDHPVRADVGGSGWMCRPLAAADITSGVLSTARYSAYADLIDESQIDGATGQTLLSRNAADLRFVNTGEAVSNLSLSVTEHSVTAAATETENTVASSKNFCALATGTTRCAITRGGSSYTLTATGSDTASTSCTMFCF